MPSRHIAPRPPRAARHALTGRRHRFARLLALSLVAVLSFGATAFATAYVQLDNNIETHDVSALLGQDRPVRMQPVDPEDPFAEQPLNILLVGSDDRGGQNAELGGDNEGMRSDTTIVLHISGDRQRVELVSIPRDSQVQIPACTRSDGTTSEPVQDRFNEAFSIGAESGEVSDAVACTIRTVESLTGLPLDSWLVVDFAGFVEMVDALGGIPLCIPHDMVSPKAGLDLAAGQHRLDGTTALAFARARTGTGVGDGSDTNRLGRQQQLLAATAREVLSKNLLTDSSALLQFLHAATRSLTADPSLGSIRSLSGLAYSLRDLPAGNITFMTVPFAPYAPDPNRVAWTEEADQVWANMAADVPVVEPPAAPPAPAEPAPGAGPATPEPAPAAPAPVQPGVDPFTPDDVTTECA